MLYFLYQTQFKILNLSDQEIHSGSKYQSIQLDAIVSINSIKLGGYAEKYFDDWKSNFSEYLSLVKKRVVFQQGVVAATISSLQTTIPLLILLVSLVLVSMGHLSLGQAIALQTVVSSLFYFTSSLFNIFSNFLVSSKYIELSEDIFEYPIEKKIESPLKVSDGSIILKDINFKYTKDSSWALKNINLEIKDGETIALVGKSGSGKSTLAKIVCTLFEPTNGQIMFGGQNYDNYNLDILRESISYIPQEAHLHNRKIIENIDYKDYTLLEDAFLSKNTRIEQVYPMDSAPHNGGRIVLCFVDSNSQRIIYKPRSLTVDKLVREIFQDALNIENTLGFIPVPLSLDCEGYGWQKYIEKSHVNHCELDKSYFNLGYCSAVFSCLGAVDLHDENIIFNKNRPYFIDLETVFQPANKRVIKKLVDTVNEMLLNSIVTTTIMPSKLSVFPHDILIGGINTLFPQETNEKVFRLKDFGTDGMDIVKETIKSTKQSTSFLFDSARDIRPLEFQTEFIAGYEKGYYKVLQSKNQIKRVVSEGDCILRVVLRPTTQYYLLIDACLYPENLTSLESINNNVLNYIKSSKIFTSDLDTQNIISEEKDMLISGDIPYFYIKYDSNYLETFSGFQSRCFEMSPKENLLNRLDKSSEKQLSLDKRFIAEGFSYIRMVESRFRNDLKNTEKNSPLFNKLLDSLESLDTNYMIDFLLENSIKTKNEEKMGWLTGIYGNTTLSYNSIMQVSFFDSAGILFVFEHIKNKKYTKKIISAFSELQKILDSNENGSSDSIISGKNSLLFLKGYKDQRIPEMEESLISNKSNLYANDLFLQPIGVSHVLSTFSCSNFELMKSQLKSIDYVNSDFKKFGIAHGKLGIKWAEFRLNQKLNNFEQSDLIFQSVLEMMAEVKKVENGWCNGSSGLLMVLYEMARRLNKRIDLFEFARNCTEIDDYDDYLEIDLSVCHGVAGKVQSLLFVYAITDDKRFLDLANKYWKKVFVIAKKNGYYTGEKSRDYLLGYFLGWSGIIDTAILLKNYNKGEKSYIPLNLSSESYQKELFNIK